jgi:hypothetical protein
MKERRRRLHSQKPQMRKFARQIGETELLSQ